MVVGIYFLYSAREALKVIILFHLSLLESIALVKIQEPCSAATFNLGVVLLIPLKF